MRSAVVVREVGCAAGQNRGVAVTKPLWNACLRGVGISSLVICLLLLATNATASAGGSKPSAPAEQLISTGLEWRRAGQDAEALSKFKEAYTLAPTPRAAAQWGLCLQAVGRWSEADARLSEALKSAKDPWIIKNRFTLKQSLEEVKKKVARVEVNGTPDGATVAINGHEVGNYPLAGAVPVNAGNVDIEVTKPGYKRVLRSMNIAGGQYERLVIRLDKENTETASLSQSLDLAPPMAAGAPLQGDLNLAADEQSPGSPPIYKRPWVWALTGAVVAGVVVALVLAGRDSDPRGPLADHKGVFDP